MRRTKMPKLSPALKDLSFEYKHIPGGVYEVEILSCEDAESPAEGHPERTRIITTIRTEIKDHGESFGRKFTHTIYTTKKDGSPNQMGDQELVKWAFAALGEEDVRSRMEDGEEIDFNNELKGRRVRLLLGEETRTRNTVDGRQTYTANKYIDVGPV
jgi:hypothetical protein